jgi:nucleoside-diphosphate-sugar epimerase
VNDSFARQLEVSFAGKTVLVTGGAGYIASGLLQLLKNTECRIMLLDRPAAEFPRIDGKARTENVYADIRDRDIWKKVLPGVNFVFHFAAQTSTYAANDDPLGDAEINIQPLLRMLETCRSDKLQPDIVFSSTVTVAGIAKKIPVDESQSCEPVTVYDLHKLAAENYLAYYSGRGYARGVALRLSNVYGPGPKSSSSDRGILNMMMRKALARERLTVYGTGEYLRDYTFVDDVAAAFLMAAVNMERVNGGRFIIGSGEGHTIAEAINLVADRAALKTGRRVDVVHVEPKTEQSPIELRNFVADSGRFSRATGWKAGVSLVDGIDRTLGSW